jgi:hypothetical protein
MYMYTQGHWWTDRVDAPNEHLQRERLGGIALRRNQTYPGNAVSWRFADPESGQGGLAGPRCHARAFHRDRVQHH